MPGARSMSVNTQVAIGCAVGFLVLAVIGFVFVSTTSGVVMLVLAVVWPVLFKALFGDGREGREGHRDRGRVSR